MLFNKDMILGYLSADLDFIVTVPKQGPSDPKLRCILIF